MMRLSSMNDTSGLTQPVVNNIQYNAASQLTAISYYSVSEARTYNNLLQLTNITAGSALNVIYNYTPGGNSGKITSTYDAVSGEAVVYQYDALNRLLSAQGTGWAQTQAYDGFGNLTSRVGYGAAQSTTISTPVNAATNQLSGYTYDANGNLISTGYAYDAENRISSVNAGAVEYFYDAQNKRIWEAACNPNACSGSNWLLQSQTINLFGADGKQLATYSVGTTVVNNQVSPTWGPIAIRSYFGRPAGGAAIGDQQLPSGGARPAGLGGQVLSLWRGAQLPAVAQRPGEVRHLHSGFGDRERLCRSTLLHVHPRPIHNTLFRHLRQVRPVRRLGTNMHMSRAIPSIPLIPRDSTDAIRRT